MISRTWRACCALTSDILIMLGFPTASTMAVFVISWKMILCVVSTGKSNTLHICQAIASPSRSSSDANIMFVLLNLAIIVRI